LEGEEARELLMSTVEVLKERNQDLESSIELLKQQQQQQQQKQQQVVGGGQESALRLQNEVQQLEGELSRSKARQSIELEEFEARILEGVSVRERLKIVEAELKACRNQDQDQDQDSLVSRVGLEEELVSQEIKLIGAEEGIEALRLELEKAKKKVTSYDEEDMVTH